jgi:hypothetical protein
MAMGIAARYGAPRTRRRTRPRPPDHSVFAVEQRSGRAKDAELALCPGSVAFDRASSTSGGASAMGTPDHKRISAWNRLPRSSIRRRLGALNWRPRRGDVAFDLQRLAFEIRDERRQRRGTDRVERATRTTATDEP